MTGLLLAARPFYLSGGLMLYALGVLAGSRRDAAAIAVGTLVVVLVHVVTHYVNDAEDVVTDDRTASPTAFTGGSRAIQRGLVTPAVLLRAGAVLSAVVGGVVAWEIAEGDGTAAALHLAILVLGYAYSGRPFALGRRGLGEVTTATVMGVLVPLAGAHAAGGTVPVAILALLFVMTLFARLCTAWPDVDADRDTGKRTLPVLLGPAHVAIGFAVTALVVAGVGVFAGALAAAPVTLAAAWIAWMIHTGRAARRPVLVPMAGVAAYGAGLFVLLATPPHGFRPAGIAIGAAHAGVSGWPPAYPGGLPAPTPRSRTVRPLRKFRRS